MQQQVIRRVSLSVGTKLLASVFVLLALAVGFLTYSAVYLMTEDKRAYTFQSQATEAALMGKDFTGTTRRGMEILRQVLGTINPLLPVMDAQKSILQAQIDNQTDLVALSVQLVDPATGKELPVTQHVRVETLTKCQLKVEDLTVQPAMMLKKFPDLLSKGYAFLNLSRRERPPLLAIAVADLNLKANPTGLPVAIAFLPLSEFGRAIRQSHLTIASVDGDVLFDTDPDTLFGDRSIMEDPLFEFSKKMQLTSGTRDYEMQGGKRYLGSYFKPGLDLIVLTRIEWLKAMVATKTLTQNFELLGLISLGAGIIFAIFFARTITSPINRLFRATSQVASGNFDVQLKAKSHDEIGILTDSFTAMSKKIGELIQESVRKVHLENELAIATTVQKALLPPAQYKDERIDMASVYQSATECGGDWWGFFKVRNQTCLMIADATGHGLPSALITAAAQSSISVVSKLAQEMEDFSMEPGRLLTYANRAIYGASKGAIMMTFFLGVIDHDTMKMRYASAGHNPQWLFRLENGTYTQKSLVSPGNRLGEASDVPDFEQKEVDLKPGDVLFMYTDGIMEGKNVAGEMYGKKRVLKICKEVLPQGHHPVVDALAKEFHAFNSGKEYDDDVTLVTARIV